MRIGMVFFDPSSRRRFLIVGSLFLFACLAIALAMSALLFFETKAEMFARSPRVEPNLNDPIFEKTIALTFDDGPDPVYTLPIARYLESEGVPATFFLIGEHVLHYPAIVRALIDKGFEIGNHSFSHSSAVHESPERIRRELTATDHALVYATGRSPVLYRPPFLLDVGFGIVDGHRVQNETLRNIESHGLTIVSADIDTTDWEKSSVFSEDEIYRILIAGAKAGKHVVLLHDHGGDGATLEALQRFIPEMKEAGYTFVPVSHFYGLTRDEAMPYASLSLRDYALIVFLHIISTESLLLTLAGIIAVLSLMRMLMILGSVRVLSFIPLPQVVRTNHSFAVIVPAYNEEANISATLHSVIQSTLAPARIIVVDDGSTDSTATIVRAFMEKSEHNVTLLQKDNGGTKAGALQYALECVTEDVVICIDADTIIEKHAFERMLSHFSRESVGAVAGKVYPATTNTFMEKLQYLEYVQGQNLDKRVFALWNSVGIVPGAIGAWRTKALKDVGGYTTDTVVEDQDLTLAMLTHGWNIDYEPRALAYTETPSTIRAFFNQRFRWIYGTMQCFYKYDRWLFSPERQWLGLIVLPNILFFNIVFPFVAPLLDIVALAGLFGYVNAPIIVASFLIFLFLDVWLAWEGMSREKTPRYTLLLWIPVQRVVYQYVAALAVIKSIITALSGSMVHWGRLVRRGAAAEALLNDHSPDDDTPDFVGTTLPRPRDRFASEPVLSP